jgi:hypothetical protein
MSSQFPEDLGCKNNFLLIHQLQELMNQELNQTIFINLCHDHLQKPAFDALADAEHMFLEHLH